MAFISLWRVARGTRGCVAHRIPAGLSNLFPLRAASPTKRSLVTRARLPVLVVDAGTWPTNHGGGVAGSTFSCVKHAGREGKTLDDAVRRGALRPGSWSKKNQARRVAMLYASMGDTTRALEVIDAALAVYPGNALIRMERAYLLEASGRRPQAEAELRSIPEVRTGIHRYWCLRGYQQSIELRPLCLLKWDLRFARRVEL